MPWADANAGCALNTPVAAVNIRSDSEREAKAVHFSALFSERGGLFSAVWLGNNGDKEQTIQRWVTSVLRRGGGGRKKRLLTSH